MQEGKWARIIPDRNGEALLDYPEDKAIWLSDILDELLEAGLITEDEYWYPYVTIFVRLVFGDNYPVRSATTILTG